MSVLSVDGLTKTYVGGDGGLITVFDGVDLDVERGEMVAIVGASGAGKSTLLHLLGALDRPTAGHVRIGGRVLDGMDDDEVSTLRNRTVGFVFQFHHLLREFTALENVMMPLRIGGMAEKPATDRAVALLERVGLGGRLHHRPAALSGGEQQRTAVARALAADPQVLLADEPSGNLDAGTGQSVLELLRDLNRERRLTMIMVTHDAQIAQQADRVVRLAEGRIEEWAPALA